MKACSHINLHMNVHCGLINNAPKVEATQMSISWEQINKPWYSQSHDGILFNCKKEGSTDSCYTTEGHWKHYGEWRKPDTKGHRLCDYVYIKFLEKPNLERQRGVSGCQGRGVEAEMKSSCLTDAGFLLEMIKIFWNYMVVVCEYTKNHWVSILNG